MYAPRSSGSGSGSGQTGTLKKQTTTSQRMANANKVNNALNAVNEPARQQFAAYQEETYALENEYNKAKQEAIMKGASDAQLRQLDNLYNQRFEGLEKKYGY